METRASHSSPCFLRVAEASAASSASKITSLSTPFSFETASTTIKISLFMSKSRHTAPGTLRSKPRFTDFPEGHLYLLLINFHRNARIVRRQQRARITAAALARRPQLYKHPLAHKSRKMRRGAQHPVET